MLFSHKILLNGNTEKEYRFMVDIVPSLFGGIDCGHLPSLGMVNPNPSFSVHCLCERHGHYV